MRIFLILLILAVCTACEKLPAEKQKALQEEANSRKIQRVTQQQLVEFLLPKTEALDELLNQQPYSQELENAVRQKLDPSHPLVFLGPAEIENNQLQQIVEAYMFSVASGDDVKSNLQDLTNGDFLYTIPYVQDSGGIAVFKGVWKVEFSRKDLIQEYVRDSDD